MRWYAPALALVLVSRAAAYADGPIVVGAGIGYRRTICVNDVPCQLYTKQAPALQTEVGYRILASFAVGIRAAIARNTETVIYGDSSDPYRTEFQAPSTSVQLGGVAQWSVDRYWLALWAGFDDRADGDDERRLGFGLAGGVDVYVAPSGNRFGVYLDVTRSYDVYLTGGIAYRFW